MIKNITLGWILMLSLLSSALFSQQCLTLYGENQAVAPGEEFCVDIKVNGFNNLIAFQHSISFDPTQLHLNSIEGEAFSNMNFGNPNEIPDNDNHITVNWVDFQLLPKDLADGSVLFTLCFDAIGAAGEISALNIGDGYLLNEFLDETEQITAVSFINPNILITTSGNFDETLNISDACTSASFCAAGTGEIQYTLSGGVEPYLYSWTGPGGFASSGATISGLSSGLYHLVVTDQNGYSIYANFDVVDYSLGEITSNVLQPNCEDETSGSITLTKANGGDLTGYLFEWSNGASNAFIDNLSAGDYTVTVTTASGDCEVVFYYNLEVAPVVVTSGNCHLEDGDVVAEIEVEMICGLLPPLSFAWSNGAVTSSDSTLSSLTIINPVFNQAYNAVVTDANGTVVTSQGVFFNECGGSFVVEAEVFSLNCEGEGGSIYLTTTPAGDYYTYDWSNGATSAAITNLIPGFYAVVVTNIQNGETFEDSYQILDETGLVLSASYECLTGTEAVNVTAVSWNGMPPFTYAWSTGETFTTEERYNTVTLANGTYDVTVTDGSGCSGVQAILASCSAAIGIEITPSTQTISAGESLCFDFDVSNFTNIAAMQFSIHWDPNLLSFETLTDFGLENLSLSNFGVFPDEGLLTFAWFDAGGGSVSLSDGSTVFSICLTTQNAGSGTLSINSIPTPIEVVGEGGVILNINSNTAFYTIGAQSTAATLGTSTETAQQGDEVCVQVFADDLGSVLTTQFSLNWDPTQLAFEHLDLEHSSLPNLGSPNFGIGGLVANGLLSFSWLDMDLTGVSIENEEELFSICFNVLSSDGFAPVSIAQEPIAIEIIDIEEQVLFPQITNGGVNISDGLVWPGDADDNGVVNNFDLLNIGLAYNSTGAIRTSASSNWIGQSVENWDGQTPQSHINYKYADCDGNGAVNLGDKALILTNWEETNELWNGNINGFNETPNANTTLSTIPIYVDAFDVEEGTDASFDIVLGADGTAAEHVYGLAFTLIYDPAIVVPNSLGIDFSNSWLGQENQDFITLYKNDDQNGRVKIAMTRIDGQPITGSGAIASLFITIEDVIFRDDYQMYFDIQNIRAINSNEEVLLTAGQPTHSLVTSTVGYEFPAWQSNIEIFPNPVTDRLNIRSEEAMISNIKVMSIEGKQLLDINHSTNFSMKSFAPGIYYLKLQTNKGLVYKKIIKQ